MDVGGGRCFFEKCLFSIEISLILPQYQQNKSYTMNEDTVFDQKEVKNQSDKKEKEVKKKGKSAPDKNQQNQEKEGELEGKKKKITSSRVTTAASVAGLAVRLITPLNLFPKSPSEEKEAPISDVITNTNEPEFNTNEPEIEPEPAPEVSSQLEGRDMTVASEVNDSMSFNEAFAAARQAIGPGGLFVWHGHAYGTYYKNEWDAMSQEDQDQYWADVHHTTEQIHYEEYESDSVSGLDTDQDLEVVIEQKQDGEEEVEAVVDEDELQEEEVALVDSENVSGMKLDFGDEAVNDSDEFEEPIEAPIEDDDEMVAVVDDNDDNNEPNFAMGTGNEDMEESWPIEVDMDENEDVANAEIEMMEADVEMDASDDEMYGHEADFASPHADIDDFASTSFDSEAEIDDDIDVSDFS